MGRICRGSGHANHHLVACEIRTAQHGRLFTFKGGFRTRDKTGRVHGRGSAPVTIVKQKELVKKKKVEKGTGEVERKGWRVEESSSAIKLLRGIEGGRYSAGRSDEVREGRESRLTTASKRCSGRRERCQDRRAQKQRTQIGLPRHGKPI